MNATLSSRLYQDRSLAGEACLVLGGAALTAVCSQIAVPWLPVPFTLQTFSVLLCGLILGSRRGALSQLTYVAGGAVGLPVFAGFTGGFWHLAGPTGGYLMGFVLAAGLVGYFAERGWDRKAWTTAAAMAIGSIVILALGFAWLTVFIGPAKAFWAGVVPFLAGDAIKAVAAACALPVAWRYVK
jgi:biotin transport system substrate-specific component